MILTDDNFCSIVKAVRKGRTIYAGIQKFVSFIMSVHFAEVLQIFLCVVIGYGIEWFGWVLALIGALICMTGCELYKCYVKHYAPPPI